MLNPDEQHTYLSYPPEAINPRDYSELPEFNQERMTGALDFFRGQFIAMERPSDARNIEEMGYPPMRMFSSITDTSGRHVGIRIPVLVKKGETAGWNQATKTYEIRQMKWTPEGVAILEEAWRCPKCHAKRYMDWDKDEAGKMFVSAVKCFCGFAETLQDGQNRIKGLTA